MLVRKVARRHPPARPESAIVRSMIRLLAIAIISSVALSVCAQPCPVAGTPPLVVTQVQEAGSGDWYKTAAELAATQMQGGTAVVVQSEIGGALVDVIVWMHRPSVEPPPPSSYGWKVERFFSMRAAAERYEALATTNTSTRLVSSIWGGVACRATILDRFSDVAWVVYYDNAPRRRASRH